MKLMRETEREQVQVESGYELSKPNHKDTLIPGRLHFLKFP